ncbi:hypothetical protein CU097_006147 [Rhizopus azygosporus]|uniref:Uncharacterized protein n=1 Tax=Rhizopus azygosporus TaxID=86630 RepID=A0A367JI89_RHIAZ|nr:hypothetical protein CU097_006147 [Rhizopus azygosporus]
MSKMMLKSSKAFFAPSVVQETKLKQFGAELKVGEACLVSISKQLKELGIQDNERFQYKADGIIKLYDLKQLEILLLETSGSFGNTGKVKIILTITREPLDALQC